MAVFLGENLRFLFLILAFLSLFVARQTDANTADTEYAKIMQEIAELEKDAIYPTEEEADAFLEEFMQAYEDAKAKEQSFANRMLGGLTMAATGIGGMMLAQSLAEQGADADAEMDMRAYLETFICKYADGKSFKGGTENIELPGGNDLLPLYTEYVNLANDLKVRKEALGMRPGIESEKILDNATSGLYDDVALGKTGGAYASLARALQDPEGEDAKIWAEQKDKTKKNLTIGASVGGVGAVGGVVGNAIINRDPKTDASAPDINKITDTVNSIKSGVSSK